MGIRINGKTPPSRISSEGGGSIVKLMGVERGKRAPLTCFSSERESRVVVQEIGDGRWWW
jgi:hypothetical protein